jgi:hypothetical protein|uniref:Uncharacterized protein n=1 Tax=Siphoviridae sp. ctsf32 TaxID=2827594 RepID=A0A8S5LN38_9CAUD|nr:MAG TPA: hypothetical protein [Siphoviridae sp. ctsf32]
MARLIDADEFIEELYSEFHGMISDESLKIYQIIQRIDAAQTVKSVPLYELKYILKFLSDDKQLLSRGKRDLELLIKTYEEG